MSKNKLSVLTGLIWLTWLILGAHHAEPVSIGAAHLEESVDAPLMFIENVGQFADDARFQVWGGSNTMWLAEDALWMTVVEADNKVSNPPAGAKSENAAGVNLKLRFVGANPQPTMVPFQRLATRVNYYRGHDPAKWRTNVPVWGGVRYVDLYPGVDLEITSEAGQVVSRIVANPDADLEVVRLRVEGADDIEMLSPSEGAEGGQGIDSPSPRIGRGGRGVRAGRWGEGLLLTTAIGDVTLPLLQAMAPDGTSLDLSTTPPKVNGTDISAPFAPTSAYPKEMKSSFGSENCYSAIESSSPLLPFSPSPRGRGGWGVRAGHGATFVLQPLLWTPSCQVANIY